MLLFLLPVFVVLYLAIRLDSCGPVVFRQSRVGRNGREFTMYKFRSMVVDAPRLGGHQTRRDDPRITRIGRLLRKSSLDELPQLFNVLKGDMSFVGPRPDVPAQRVEYAPSDWETRHRVRPGITGLAQATLRSSAQAGERLALDLEYVRRANFWLDMRILLLTARQVMFRGGY